MKVLLGCYVLSQMLILAMHSSKTLVLGVVVQFLGRRVLHDDIKWNRVDTFKFDLVENIASIVLMTERVVSLSSANHPTCRSISGTVSDGDERSESRVRSQSVITNTGLGAPHTVDAVTAKDANRVSTPRDGCRKAKLALIPLPGSVGKSDAI